MNITFGGHAFLLDPSGILFWPSESLLVVSDMHLEKGSHFAARGFFLPPYDTNETLSRLLKIITALAPKRLLLLGDCFHDGQGYHRLSGEDRPLFDRLRAWNPLWIKGNHDGEYVPPGFAAHDAYELSGLTFRHEASADTPLEISGHFHPKVEIIHKNAFISRACFIEDGNKMILPSFGAYTGGLSVNHASLAGHIKTERRIYILGAQKVYCFDRTSLEPSAARRV